MSWFNQRKKTLRLQSWPELRMRASPSRVRIPGVVVSEIPLPGAIHPGGLERSMADASVPGEKINAFLSPRFCQLWRPLRHYGFIC